MNVSPFIEAENVAGHSVKRSCELLEISRAGAHVACSFSALQQTPTQRHGA
ncbi:MAG TPA: hypothetical protein VK988_22740 [Acidimicrobiales bacterium]|nr:hypothetical protein [Acidimicrobiales bacterium]